MDQNFWNERWEIGRIGFHRPEPNKTLVSLAERLLPRPGRVLVPLSGKTPDMRWLRDAGHRVVGVEFVDRAWREFFAEQGLEVERHQDEAGGRYESPGITGLQRDIFSLGPDEAGLFDAVYDRAALIALPAALRPRYPAHIASLVRPGGKALVITLTYDQSVVDGPPFSVDETELRDWYEPHFEVDLIERREESPPGRMAEAGLNSVAISDYLMTRR